MHHQNPQFVLNVQLKFQYFVLRVEWRGILRREMKNLFIYQTYIAIYLMYPKS